MRSRGGRGRSGWGAAWRGVAARLPRGATEDELREEAFAGVRAAAWRTLALRPYDVQLIGAMALNDGLLAQM